MRRLIVPLLGILVALSLIMFDLTILSSGRTALRPTLQKGVALGLYRTDRGMSYYRPVLDRISSLGVTHLSLPVYYFQDTIDATVLYSKPTDGATPEQHDRVVREVISYAHRLGMKILLVPIVDIENPIDNEWRGVIAPENWEKWFESYRTFLVHYAEFAQGLDVEFMSVGTELVSTENRTDEWRQTIRAVRRVFAGKLVYSANWDHYDSIAFWDDLDFLGLSAYYELVPYDDPTFNDLVLGWTPIKRALIEWQRQWGKPLLFTEVGYTSQSGAGRQPWNYTAAGTVNLGEQERCYMALKAVWENEPEFAGLYLWNVEPEIGGPGDTNYTFLGKPAEDVVSEWYRGVPPDAGLADYAVNIVERFFRSIQ